MTSYDKQRLVEIVLYILNKTNGLDYYHLFKVIYFANLNHLAKYGFPMVKDEFYALPDGPVPTKLYDCVKKKRSYSDKELSSMLEGCVEKGNEDADYMMEAKRQPDMDYLSQADIEMLNLSIEENAHMPYTALKEKSHGKEWNRAFNGNNPKKMTIIGMAQDSNASPEMIKYIIDNHQIENSLA